QATTDDLDHQALERLRPIDFLRDPRAGAAIDAFASLPRAGFGVLPGPAATSSPASLSNGAFDRRVLGKGRLLRPVGIAPRRASRSARASSSDRVAGSIPFGTEALISPSVM